MDFAKINQIASGCQFLPCKKLKELEEGKNYHLTSIRKVETKYGLKIKVDIDNEFTVFLPARMTKIAQDATTFANFVTAVEENQVTLHYIGGPYNKIEFL